MGGQLEWQRGFPSRALRHLGWFALAGAVVTGIAWLLFGAEPGRLASGEPNPMAFVPRATAALAAIVAAPALAAVVRRPRVAANHYALTVRPGALRALMLPWAEITEVAGRRVDGVPLLLVRCAAAPGPGGSRGSGRPRWYDQRGLRRAGHGLSLAYHLAVRVDEFAGPPALRMAELAAWAPRHVYVTSEL